MFIASLQEKTLNSIESLDQKPDRKQVIVFDDSALEPAFNYMRNRSEKNLDRLASQPGSKLAHAHYCWANSCPKITAEEFWSKVLSETSWNHELEHTIDEIKTYLLGQKKEKWLNEVLRYLPRKHYFNTIVYLNFGYDHIVFGENVALNLNSNQFRLDRRESIYYLIHELAHAGYVRYHPMPDLGKIRTNRQLLETIEYLTQLEGMGVKSALRLRIRESGLLDNDYKTLLDDSERTTRVTRYFKLLDKLESKLPEGKSKSHSGLIEEMSGKKTRLWYIAGCHMAQEIEKQRGTETLRKLVKEGSEAFFRSYFELTPRST